MENVDILEEKQDPNKGGKSRLVKVLLKPAVFVEFEKARELAGFGGYGHMSDYVNHLFISRREVDKYRWLIIKDVAKTIKKFNIQDFELKKAKDDLSE